MKKNEVPLELKQFLPVIPDRLGFTKNQLEIDNAWNRYQDHHFLFMKMSKEHKASLGECLSKLTPSQRVVWIGCLGREEILALLLPMVSQQSRFMNLIEACQEISPSDSQNYPFVYRVWEALNDIYKKYLQNKETTSEEIHQLFRQVFKEDTEILPHEKPAPSGSSPVPTGSSPAITTDVANLSDIKHLSFLVVDDSERIRQMTIKVLKEAGINTISEATDGVEAWSFLQKQAVDVILCDWIMPNMTGMELVQKMMQVDSIASKTSFLMLTTVNNKAAIVEALSVGVRGYLIKPFTRKQLLEKVFFATEWLRKEQVVD